MLVTIESRLGGTWTLDHDFIAPPSERHVATHSDFCRCAPDTDQPCRGPLHLSAPSAAELEEAIRAYEEDQLEAQRLHELEQPALLTVDHPVPEGPSQRVVNIGLILLLIGLGLLLTACGDWHPSRGQCNDREGGVLFMRDRGCSMLGGGQPGLICAHDGQIVSYHAPAGATCTLTHSSDEKE